MGRRKKHNEPAPGDRRDQHGRYHRLTWRAVLKQNLRFAAPYRTLLSVAFLLSFLASPCSALIAWLSKEVANSFQSADAMVLVQWVGAAFGVLLAQMLLQIGAQSFMARIHAVVGNDIRHHLFLSVAGSTSSVRTDLRTGELLNLFSTDVEQAAGSMIEAIGMLLVQPWKLLCLLAVMFHFSPLLTVCILGAFPLVAFVSSQLGRRSRAVQQTYMHRMGLLFSELIESLVNARQVHAYSLQKATLDKIKREESVLVKQRVLSVVLRAATGPVTEISYGIFLVIVGVVAWHLRSADAISWGDIVGCFVAAMGMKRPVKSMTESHVRLHQASAAWDRIEWLLSQQEQPGTEERLSGGIETIEMENVAFSYDGKREIFRDVSATFTRGDHVALIGPSGVGKSTLLDLLIGFYPCSEGDVRVNGLPVGDVGSALRREVGVVFQEPFLFDGTIMENVRLVDETLTEDEVSTLLADVGFDISRHPQGVHQQVGERGRSLSGGERKRIALARALARKVSVLILDEATSELDASVERDILSRIADLCKDRIVLHVSHRERVVSYCNRILELKDFSLFERPVEESGGE